MKLDFDCVRDVLLIIEEEDKVSNNMIYMDGINFPQICEKLNDYEEKQIFYTIKKLVEAGYIISAWMDNNKNDMKYYYVIDITFKGHEYLNSVRNDKAWEFIKTNALALSLRIIPKLAESYALNHLNFLK